MTSQPPFYRRTALRVCCVSWVSHASCTAAATSTACDTPEQERFLTAAFYVWSWNPFIVASKVKNDLREFRISSGFNVSHSRDRLLEVEAVGRPIELVFGDGQEEQGGSGSGMRGGRDVHGAVRFRIWPSQQVMRELPEGGVGGKRTRSGRRREEGETVAFITSSGSQAT
jgi:hypothetical protein